MGERACVAICVSKRDGRGHRENVSMVFGASTNTIILIADLFCDVAKAI